MGRKAVGFGEQRQAQLGTFQEHTRIVDGGRLKIGPGGRVVIPADVREALGVREGDTLLASLVGGELRLMPMASALAEARALVREVIPAGSPSVVDELIADRRREQAEEDKKNR